MTEIVKYVAMNLKTRKKNFVRFLHDQITSIYPSFSKNIGFTEQEFIHRLLQHTFSFVSPSSYPLHVMFRLVLTLIGI